jgi:hypothetical protein
MKNTNKEIFIFLSLIILTIISRLIFAESIYYNYDGGTFALASMKYNMKLDMPHLPGYYLHVQLIKLFSTITGGPHSAMIFLSALYSGLAAGFIYKIFRKWLSIRESLLLDLFILTNPFIWFFGCTSEIYSFDLFFSSFLVLAGLSGRWIYLMPVILALGTGVRQSSGVFLLPLFLYLWYLYFRKNKISIFLFTASFIIAIAIILLWFIPMTDSVGGISQYIQMYKSNNPIPIKQTIDKNFANASSYGLYILIPFLIVFVPVLKNWKKNNNKLRIIIKNEYELLLLVIFWVIPSVVFFNLVHYSKGYYYICIVGMNLLLIIFYNKKLIGNKLMLIISILQISAFIFLPYKQPSTDIIFNSKARTTNKLQTWLARMQSPYSLGQNQLRELDRYYFQIREGLNYFEKNESHSKFGKLGKSEDGLNYFEKNDTISKMTFFTDPTLPITARVLEPVYPHISFTFMNKDDFNSYFLFRGLYSVALEDFEEMMARSIIIGSPEFAHKFIKEYIDILLEYENICFYKVKDNRSKELKNKFDYYFLK